MSNTLLTLMIQGAYIDDSHQGEVSMKMSTLLATSFMLAVSVSGLNGIENHSIADQKDGYFSQKAQGMDDVLREPIVLAGNTACNPRAQVCED